MWINDEKNLVNCSVVTDISLNKKGTGYILKTPDFDCFLWKEEQLAVHLNVAIASWVDTNAGHVLEAFIDPTEKRGFNVRVKKVKDKPVPGQWFCTVNGYSTKEGETVNNPFL